MHLVLGNTVPDHSTEQVLQSLDAGQREELHRCLDAALVVQEQCSLSDVQRGWILMEVGAQKVCSADALLCAVPKNGRVWCKLGDPDSLRIKITKDEAQLDKSHANGHYKPCLQPAMQL